MNLHVSTGTRPKTIPVPEPDLTPEKLFGPAVALLGLLREQQD